MNIVSANLRYPQNT